MVFSDFKAAVKAVAFPKGEAENLVTVYNNYILEGLVEIQKWVDCFQENNLDLVERGDTTYSCGLTVIDAPNGQVQRIFAVDSRDSCSKIYYHKRTLVQLQEMAARESADYCLPFEYPTGDDEVDRALVGYWTYQNGLLYVWPYLHSEEILGVEWKGIKLEYSDTDEVYSSSPQVQKTVRSFLKREIARDITCNDNELARHSESFGFELANLLWECRQKQESGVKESTVVHAIRACSSDLDDAPDVTLLCLETEAGICLETESGEIIEPEQILI